MRKLQIAYSAGDGSGPEMGEVAKKVVVEAAKLDDTDVEFVNTPFGWNAYHNCGDTRPQSSLDQAKDIGTLYFMGVGDPKYDNTIGAEFPEMKPEPRALLYIRKDWGLLHNFRYFYYTEKNKHLARVNTDKIPPQGITQLGVRFLLEDTYFGNLDLRDQITLSPELRRLLKSDRLKLHSEIGDHDEIFIDLAYYLRSSLIRYFTFCFEEARRLNLPLICVSKHNVSGRYLGWKKVCDEVSKNFPDVKLKHVIVDTAAMHTVHPELLHGIIAFGNEHGDIITDIMAEINGSMGLMASSAINILNGLGMFESGTGTFPDGAGKDIANPIGRILTGGLMLRHKGLIKGAVAIEKAVQRALDDGYMTPDLVPATTPQERLLKMIKSFDPSGLDDETFHLCHRLEHKLINQTPINTFEGKIVGTKRMGELILDRQAA